MNIQSSYEKMVMRAEDLYNSIEKIYGSKIKSMSISSDANRFPKLPYGTTSGMVKIDIAFKNRYGATIIWNPFTDGSALLLWELRVNRDLTEFPSTELFKDDIGYLYDDEVLDRISIISKLNKYDTN